MSVVVSYKSNALYPPPLYSISQEIKRTAEGTPISVVWSINLEGSIVAGRGSPKIDGTFSLTDPDPQWDELDTEDDHFEAIGKKKAAIQELFQESGLEFLIQTDSHVAVNCYPKVDSVSFDSGTDVMASKYSIKLSAHELVSDALLDYPNIDDAYKYNLQSASEDFNITTEMDTDEDGSELPVFNIKYTVSGSAHTIYGSELSDNGLPHGDDNLGAYENARSYVLGKIGSYDDGIETGSDLEAFLNGTSYFSDEANVITNFFVADISLSESGNKLSGSYSATKTLKLLKSVTVDSFPYSVRHEYGVQSTRTAPLNDATLGYSNDYSLQGTITGLRTESSTAYENAREFYKDQINDAHSYKDIIAIILDTVDEGVVGGGGSISHLDNFANIAPVSKTVTHNKRKGIITYNFSFKETVAEDDPAGGQYFSDFSIKASDSHDDNKVAIINIPGRSGGPIIQDLKTTSVLTRSITGSFSLKNSGTALEGGRPWPWSSLGDIRVAAMDVIEKEPARLLGSEAGTDYFVQSWSDSLDLTGGRYEISLSLIFKRDGDSDPVVSPDGSGWWNPQNESG
jgi:hypothetical protein